MMSLECNENVNLKIHNIPQIKHNTMIIYVLDNEQQWLKVLKLPVKIGFGQFLFIRLKLGKNLI